MLLEDIRDAFADLGPRISSGDLVARLTAMEDRPWPEWIKGKPLSVRQLARLLKPFGIQPKTVRIGSSTPKGYDEDDFLESFARYVRYATATQPTSDAGFRDPSSATPPPDVADEKSRKALSQAVRGGVADRDVPERPPTEVRLY